MVRPLATMVIAGIPGGTSKYMINVYIIVKNRSAIASFTETRLTFVEKTLTADVDGLAPKGTVHSLCARERCWAANTHLLVRRAPLSEVQGWTRSENLCSTSRGGGGRTVWACGFKPAKVLIRELTTTPTAVLPGLFRELPATPGE